MGETVIEKIIRNNVGKTVKPGDIVTVNVDRVMIHDIFIPFVAEKFEEMGFTKLWDPDKAVLIYDHLVPASQLDDTRHFHAGDDFARKYGMKNVHRSDGICHQLMTEAGYVKPGNIVFGTDSHTTTYGCVGAFSSGIGYTEMASILGTGTMWIKVPETIKVVIEGELPENVMSKDIILRLIGDLGADGATYRALEFTGSTVKNMTVASRMTMANMAIEAGAKCALFTPDEKTAEYCDIELNEFQKSLTVLRNLHLDELPQLFNVFKGDMSLVGPRPERESIMLEYEKELPEFYYRLKVKAGLTGYAQVYGKYNTTPYDKLKLDLFYIENYSFLLDIKLIFMTVKIFFQKEVSEGVDDRQVNALKDSGKNAGVSENKTEE